MTAPLPGGGWRTKRCRRCKAAPPKSTTATYCASCSRARDKECRLANAALYRTRHHAKITVAKRVDPASRPPCECRAELPRIYKSRYCRPCRTAWRVLRSRLYKTGLRRALSSQHRTAILGIYNEARRSGMHVDHRTPLAGCRKCGATGTWEPANLWLLAPALNAGKRDLCVPCWSTR